MNSTLQKFGIEERQQQRLEPVLGRKLCYTGEPAAIKNMNCLLILSLRALGGTPLVHDSWGKGGGKGGVRRSLKHAACHSEFLSLESLILMAPFLEYIWQQTKKNGTGERKGEERGRGKVVERREEWNRREDRE